MTSEEQARAIAEQWRVAMYSHISSDDFHRLLADLTAEGWDDVRLEVAAVSKLLRTREAETWEQAAQEVEKWLADTQSITINGVSTARISSLTSRLRTRAAQPQEDTK